MSRSVKSEIDRRTTDASKLAALEARKVAILEMVAGLMQEAVDLMRNEGFSAPAVVHQQPQVAATVIKEASLVTAPAPQIKNPCAMCGQEASGYENMADGGKKFLCAVHYKARLTEKREEETTKQLMGSTGTTYQRPVQSSAPVKKIVIQADPLLGATAAENGGPPPNNVLDE